MKNEFEYLNDVKMDFSKYEDINPSESELKSMKKAIKHKKRLGRNGILGMAACIALVAALSQTAFAQNIFATIVKSISTGHNTFYQTDSTGMEAEIPDEYRGLLFDENGSEVKIYCEGTEYYDRSGNKIEDVRKYFKENTAAKKSEDPLSYSRECGYPIIYNIDEIDGYLCFSSQLPEYIPDGYSFYGASAYGDEYLFVYYKNSETDEYIRVHERIINEETAFSAGTDGELHEADINGALAVISDGTSADWETDGISVGISCPDSFTEEELLKIARSVK